MASISLQDLRRRLDDKAKADKPWRFARNRPGFGWKRWSRAWIYTTFRLFNDYRVTWGRA
jgi:hypothetical protein